MGKAGMTERVRLSPIYPQTRMTFCSRDGKRSPIQMRLPKDTGRSGTRKLGWCFVLIRASLVSREIADAIIITS